MSLIPVVERGVSQASNILTVSMFISPLEEAFCEGVSWEWAGELPEKKGEPCWKSAFRPRPKSPFQEGLESKADCRFVVVDVSLGWS